MDVKSQKKLLLTEENINMSNKLGIKREKVKNNQYKTKLKLKVHIKLQLKAHRKSVDRLP